MKTTISTFVTNPETASRGLYYTRVQRGFGPEYWELPISVQASLQLRLRRAFMVLGDRKLIHPVGPPMGHSERFWLQTRSRTVLIDTDKEAQWHVWEVPAVLSSDWAKALFEAERTENWFQELFLSIYAAVGPTDLREVVRL